MASRVLIPIDSTPAGSNAYEAVRTALPDDAHVVFIRVVTPDEESGRSRARSGLVRCLMVYRSRGIDSEMQLVDGETLASGIADAAARFEIDQILFVGGHGADDPTEVIEELRALTSVPINLTSDKGKTAPVG